VVSLAIERRDGSYPLPDIRERLATYGVVVLKRYLPVDIQAAIRSLLESKLEHARVKGSVLQEAQFPNADFLLGDVLGVRELEPFDFIFFRAEGIRVAKALLGSNELLYWGDSSVQFGEAARGFHKDNVDRQDGTKDDWSRSYELVRCGIYFQDHVRHSGGLKVRLRSQNYPTHLKGKIADIPTENGDLVIWNLRTTHSGNNRKLRHLPFISLHPRIEAILPPILVAPEERRRIAAFCTFGRAGSHADRYIDLMNARRDVYRSHFQHARNRLEAAELVANRGAAFRVPNDFYGELDKGAGT
jgi:hypothetical protein